MGDGRWEGTHQALLSPLGWTEYTYDQFIDWHDTEVGGGYVNRDKFFKLLDK